MPLEHPTPVFIISYNRGHMLERCIEGLARQTVGVEIVIHDNGSDDPDTLETLSRLESGGIAVYRRAKISSASELNLVEQTIADFCGRDRPDYFVTDCDVDISEADRDALAAYLWMLAKYPDAECVGPMLTILDIPPDYPLRERAFRGHIEQFWHKVPLIEDSPFGLVASIPAAIDTTLAVHRGTAPFRRLRSGRRVYAPFEARHLDWYLQEHQFTADSAASQISHWADAGFLERERGTSADEAVFFTVARDTSDDLVVSRRVFRTRTP